MDGKTRGKKNFHRASGRVVPNLRYKDVLTSAGLIYTPAGSRMEYHPHPVCIQVRLEYDFRV